MNTQVYTGKPIGGAPGKNKGTRVVLDMAHGLSGHNIVGQDLWKRRLTMVGTGPNELPAEQVQNTITQIIDLNG